MPTRWFRKTVRRLWSEPSASVTGAAALIAAASFTSRILGVFRDRVLAGTFGAGHELDVYYAAFKVPDLLYNLLIVGALSAGFIPVFIAAREKNKTDNSHWDLVNGFLSIVVAFLVVGAALLYLFATQFAQILTPGFEPDKIVEVAEMMKILSLSPVLLGVSAVIGGVLQSYRRFFVYAIAPIFYNVGIIVGALFFVSHLGIYGLAWGVVLGAVMHLFIQLPAAMFLGWRFRWRWAWRDSSVRKIGKLMVPRTLALGVTQINIFFLTVMASFLSAGSIAIFNLATNLFFVPVALFGISYALAAFPELSEAAANKNFDLFLKNIRSTMRSVLFFIIPSTVIYLILRAQIVRAVLGTGAFDWTDTVLTFETLYWFSFAMFAHALIPLLVRTFYAIHNTVIPLIAGVVGDVLTIGLSFYLVGQFELLGLAMAFSLGTIVNFSILFVWASLRFGNLLDKKTAFATLGMLMSGLVMAFVAQGVKTGIGAVYGTDTFVSILVQAGITAILALLTYVIMSFILHSHELVTLVTAIKRRLPVRLQESLEESEGL